MVKRRFMHPHCHSDYSLYDGFQRVPDMVNHAISLGFDSIGLTDHGKVGGFIKMYKACKYTKDENGKQVLRDKPIKPLFGCEFYVCDDLSEKRAKRYHLTVLAKNKEGYRNILKLCSLAHEGDNLVFIYRNAFPRLNWQMLHDHSEGLIVLSGCIVGKFANLILEEKVDEAYSLAKDFKESFGKDFYIEVMWTKYEPQKLIMKHGIEIANKLDLKIVGTNDVHYSTREDGEGQRAKVSISRNAPLKRDEYKDHEMYIKTFDEMSLTFKEILGDNSGDEYLRNTMDIADSCDNIEIELGKASLPAFEVPETPEFLKYKRQFWNTPSSEIYLRYLSEQGLKWRGLWEKSEYRERLYKEIETIRFTGFDTYFLIVHEYCEFARSKNIRIGAGRGSGVGSLVLYCLGVTGIDPVKYGLGMDRFLYAIADYYTDYEDFFSNESENEKHLNEDIKNNIMVIEDDPKLGTEEKCSC